MSGPWSYLFADVVTGALLGKVPCQTAQFSSALDSGGSLSATLLLSDPTVAAATAHLGGGAGGVLQAGRTAVYVDYSGVIVWGGVIMTTNFETTGGQPIVTLGAVDWWAFVSAQRLITWANDATATQLIFTNVDQLVIIEQLFNAAQAVPGGNLNITVPTTTSGQAVSITFDTTQYTQIDQAVSQLAQQSGVLGFDYSIDCAYNPAFNAYAATSRTNQPVLRVLNLRYPRSGRVATSGHGNGLVFNVGGPGSMGYSWPADATVCGNTWYGVGTGQGSAATFAAANYSQAAPNGTLVAIESYPAAIDGGWPLLEQTLQRSDITSQAILDAVTYSALAGAVYPVVTPTLTFSAQTATPVIGSWIIGDDARIIIPPDPWFTTGLDAIYRIASHTFTVNDDGMSTYQIGVTAPPVM